MKVRTFLCLAVSVLLMMSMVSFGASAESKETAPTGGPVYYIETYDQLKSHAYIAQADCRYVLNDDIYQDDDLNSIEIVIPTGAVFNLDLNGYIINRSTKGNDCALFRIRNGGRMTIYDSSVNKTGGCSFSEGYADYSKAVFYNEGGELEIINGYYEIYSPFEQGDCSIVRTTSGFTNIYDGTFDSSASWGGDTISVGHNAYMYDVPHVNIFGGEFYGKYQNIDVSPMSKFLSQGCLYPSVYVLGGNFYVTKDNDNSGFAYCNNGWGRVIVAEGTVLYKCLNSSDQRFLDGVSKKYFTQTIDDYTEGYYKVTAPPMIMSENIDYYYRLTTLCQKSEVNSYGESVYELHKEDFDNVLSTINTVVVDETEKTVPYFELKNLTANHKYINWYMCNQSDYCDENTQWTHIGDAQNIATLFLEERPEEAASYIIRCVVTDSELNTYEDMIRVMFEPLKTAETVNCVEIADIDEPVAGANPDYTATAIGDAFYINGVYWTDITDSKDKLILKETDTFEPGHEYELQVWIRANENYKFALDEEDYINISALINGKDAEVMLPGSAISAELSLYYEIEEEVITSSTDPSEITEPTTDVDTTPATTIEPTTDVDTTPATTIEPTTDVDTTPATTIEPTTDVDTTPAITIETTTSSDKVTEPSTHPNEDKGILGDANNDKKVNIKDATQIQKFAAKIIDFTDIEKLRADVNADSKVNIKDATAIQKYVAKIETGLPIGEPVK